MIYLFLKDNYGEVVDLENYASSEEGLKLLAKKNIEEDYHIEEFVSIEIHSDEIFVVALNENNEKVTGTYSFLTLTNIE